MDNDGNKGTEAEDIFIGKPSKQDLINYFLKQQRLVTIQKMEDAERDNSPDLSESFEIYLEQKKKKIEMEKNKLKDQQSINENKPEPNTVRKSIKIAGPSFVTSFNDISWNSDSFIELEKICENTLNLSNVSAVLNDLTTLELKTDPKVETDPKSNISKEIDLNDIEQPSCFLNNTSLMNSQDTKNVSKHNHSSLLDETIPSSFKTAHSYCPTIQSVISSDKSEYYRTANDNSFELMKSISNEKSFNLSGQGNESASFKLETSKNDSDAINDTLDEIDFLLSQAQKLNDQKEVRKDISEKAEVKKTPQSKYATPKTDHKQRMIHTPKSAQLISFSPTVENKSPFKHPKPISASKNIQFSKINNKKFQHIESPVSRYIQTSESVLNANANVRYKKMEPKRHFNFRDSENFDQTLDMSVKVSSLPLRAKTNTPNTQKSSEKERQLPQNKFKILSPAGLSRKHHTNQPKLANKFFDNTFDDLDATQ